MATGVVTAEGTGFRSRDEAEEVIDRTFRAVDEDERLAPVLRAAGLSERLVLDDLGLDVFLRAGVDLDALAWSFGPVAEDPRITLTMNGAVANAVLQGAESIGVGIARRRIRVSGDARAALVHLPATRLICSRYLDLIERDYPHLVVGG